MDCQPTQGDSGRQLGVAWAHKWPGHHKDYLAQSMGQRTGSQCRPYWWGIPHPSDSQLELREWKWEIKYEVEKILSKMKSHSLGLHLV